MTFGQPRSKPSAKIRTLSEVAECGEIARKRSDRRFAGGACPRE